MNKHQIRIIEADSPSILESAINCFLNTLDEPPLKITFGTFQRYYDYYDDVNDRRPHTKHTAQILYRANEAEHEKNHHTQSAAR